MSNIRMILNDGHRNAVLTATSEAGALVIENTQTDRRALAWRSTTLDPQAITGVSPVSVAVDEMGGIVLGNTNLTLDATVTADIKNGLGTVDTVTLECTAANPDGTTTWVAWFTLDEAVDQYEIDITDAGNAAGYVQVVQVMFGPVTTLDYNFSFGADIRWREDVEHLITDGQSLRSEGSGIVRREASINLDFIPEADRGDFINALVQQGMAAPLFLSLYPGRGGALESQHQYIAKRASQISQNHWGPMWWRQAVEFLEV